MPRLVKIDLSTNDREVLEKIISTGANWRQCQRAQTLIELDNGMSTAAVAQSVGIHRRTVSNTRRDWLKDGVDSLVDSERSGAPRKITPEQMLRLVAAASSEMLTTRQLLAKHLAEGGTPVHLNTLSAALRAHGIVWIRTRHFLKTDEINPPPAPRD